MMSKFYAYALEKSFLWTRMFSLRYYLVISGIIKKYIFVFTVVKTTTKALNVRS